MQASDFDNNGNSDKPNANDGLQGLAVASSLDQTIFQVAHDVRSPLTALAIMARVCFELDEEKRSTLLHITSQIQEMMDVLLDAYQANEHKEEAQKTVLCSDFIRQILIEKKYQYFYTPVALEHFISAQAQSARIFVQPNRFKRSISNLINNAVDALAEKQNGNVLIFLNADQKNVKISVHDNGKGMTHDMIQKLLRKISFTADKVNGHGLGMAQVWDMLECNSGQLFIHSTRDEGTTFELTFPRA